MFIWYKKGNGAGKPVASRMLRNFIIGMIFALVMGGIAFYFSNKKEIISLQEMQQLATEVGAAFHTDSEHEGVMTTGELTATIINCTSSSDACAVFDQYCAKYPKEQADTTQNIDLGDNYSKYLAAGSNGVVIAVRVQERVAIVASDDAADQKTAEDLFDKIVK